MGSEPPEATGSIFRRQFSNVKEVRGQASSPGSASDRFLSVPAEEAPVPSGAFTDLLQPWVLLVLARDIFVRCFVRCLMQNISGYEDCEG